MSAQSKLTIPGLAAKKAAGERLVMVAVGEAMSAAWAERAGIDIIDIGDSLGMTLHGHENTLAITVDQMIDHCRAVRRGDRDQGRGRVGRQHAARARRGCLQLLASPLGLGATACGSSRRSSCSGRPLAAPLAAARALVAK